MKLVDLAGAPSEFSHYVYWKRQHLVKVHVFTHLHTCMYFSVQHLTQNTGFESFLNVLCCIIDSHTVISDYFM